MPANASDSIYCGALGQYAVHAGMAGKASMMVGLVKDKYVTSPSGWSLRDHRSIPRAMYGCVFLRQQANHLLRISL
jgi:6-phosphofructokinase 1